MTETNRAYRNAIVIRPLAAAVWRKGAESAAGLLEKHQMMTTAVNRHVCLDMKTKMTLAMVNRDIGLRGRIHRGTAGDG